jgi:hypothetical protein
VYPAPADPWAGQQSTMYGSTDYLLGPPDPAPRRRRRHTWAIVVGVVLAMLVSGTAVAGAFVWYGWGTTEPEDVLPASSALFVRADLSPGLGQALQLQKLVRKFPQTQDGEDAAIRAKKQLTENLLAPLDFDKDIAPWLGDRAGAAIWSPSGQGSPCTLIALASKDDTKAKAALARVPKITYAFSKGYAVLAQCPRGGSASDAVSAAGPMPLSSNTAFADAVHQLPSGQAMLGWFDGAQYGSVLGLFDNNGPSANFNADLANLTMLVGIRAVDNGVELRARVHTSNDTTSSIDSNALSQLDSLPGATALGAAADLRTAKDLGPSVQRSIDELNRQAGTTSGADVDKLVQALLGSTLAVSVANPTANSAELKLLVQAASAGSAQDIATILGKNISGSGPRPQVSGNTVSLTSPAYQGGNGTLADDATYRAAMADPPDDVVVAAYANVKLLTPAMDLDDDTAANVRPIQAIGLALGSDHGSAELLVRMIVP